MLYLVQVTDELNGPDQVIGQHGRCSAADVKFAESVSGARNQLHFTAQRLKILLRGILFEFDPVERAERA
jgi:hypothetical protein